MWPIRFGPYQGWEILTQALKGNTTTNIGSDLILKNDFEAIYLLVSKSWSEWQAAARVDHFRVIDRDTQTDRNYQNGRAIMVTGQYKWHPRQNLRLEAMFTAAERKGNESFTNFDKVEDELVQLSYQLVF